MVDLLTRQLDDMEDPRGKAYMTCRAVEAARLDFESTDDEWNDYRSEANRRTEQLFHVRASIGMQ